MKDRGMGRRIRARRQALGLSGRQLALRAQLEPSQLSKIERGVTLELRTETLLRLAYHLGVTTDWILGAYEPEVEQEQELAAATV